jgi:23S rRNA (guanine745-N1)-methyltransferase
MTTVLACPVCGATLTVGTATAVCPAAHTFDLARNGYLNLLLSNKKQSAQPGDSPAMLLSRRTFLQGGFYEQMATAANASVVEALAGRAENDIAHVADLGCGEGYFTARLRNALAALSPSPVCYGVDVSRAGIRMATSYDREIRWIVASLHHSPFLPASLDIVLSMFAPIDAADARRIIRDAGALVTVTPGPDHLDGLRGLIYTSVMPHPGVPALMAGDTLFERTISTRVRYPVVANSAAQIMNLLTMTPYFWNISKETKARIEALSRLDFTVDAYVSVFRPRL